jgi:shikimate dehydrogenase
MTASPPLLIATCPGRSVVEVRQQLRLAADAGADVAEVRLDRLDPDERTRLDGLFPAPLPLMATLRSRAEGGEGPDAFSERRRLLMGAVQHPFRFLDVERRRDASLWESPEAGLRSDPSLVVSSHLPASATRDEVLQLLGAPRPPRSVVKVVLPCDFERLWSDLLPGLAPLRRFAPYVLHTTGATGQLLRAWAARLGMAAVYGSLPAATAGHTPEAVEPSQLPVDRLRDYRQLGGNGPLFAVVGHPIHHSRSPALHSYWFRREGRNGLYLEFDMTRASELADSLVPFTEGGFRGLNVTHPWKQPALALADRVAPAAERAGCANTLTLGKDTVSAENTDVAAVRRRLVELRDAGVWDGSPIPVLGGGGAARSALSAVSALGGSAIVVARRREIGVELAGRFGASVGIGSQLQPARLVIHATPAGREGSPTLELPWTRVIGSGTHLLDFVYEPAHPFLREALEARGGTYEDGRRLLVYQAAESYAIWWGSAPAAALQTAALTEVLCAA